MKNSIGLYVALAYLAVMLTGCASLGVREMDSAFVQSIRDSGKTTLASYDSHHLGSTAANVGAGGGLVAVAVGNAIRSSADNFKMSDNYLINLDAKCIAAMETVLLKDSSLHYIERSTLSLSNSIPVQAYPSLKEKNGVSAIIRAKIEYTIKVGSFKPPVCMEVQWEVLSPDGTCKVKINTRAIADTTSITYVNTKDPRYEAEYVLLAERNAAWFVDLLKQKNPH